VADQEATKLTESIMANTATKILLPTGSHTQFKRVADSIGLNAEQREWAQQHLDTGRALVYNRGTGLNPVDIPLSKAEESDPVDLEDMKAVDPNGLTSNTTH